LAESKLIFDPVNRTLLDARGRIVKHVNCPKLKSWHRLSTTGDLGLAQRYCDSCDKAVLDTAHMTAEGILSAVNDDPEVCFRIRLDQKNIEIKVTNA
jgi:hypothetical protein